MRVRGSSLGLLKMDALGAASKGSIWMKARGRRGWFLRRQGPSGRRSVATGRTRRSHAVANGVAGGGDVAFQADVLVAMELVMAHLVAMETDGPVAYVGIWKGFIVLG